MKKRKWYDLRGKGEQASQRRRSGGFLLEGQPILAKKQKKEE